MSLALFPIRALVHEFLPIVSALLSYLLVLPISLPCPQYICTFPALPFPSSLHASPIPQLPQYLRFYRRDSRLTASHATYTRCARNAPVGQRWRLALRGSRLDTRNKPHCLLTHLPMLFLIPHKINLSSKCFYCKSYK